MINQISPSCLIFVVSAKLLLNISFFMFLYAVLRTTCIIFLIIIERNIDDFEVLEGRSSSYCERFS